MEPELQLRCRRPTSRSHHFCAVPESHFGQIINISGGWWPKLGHPARVRRVRTWDRVRIGEPTAYVWSQSGVWRAEIARAFSGGES
jgi:hypothetical protein